MNIQTSGEAANETNISRQINKLESIANTLLVSPAAHSLDTIPSFRRYNNDSSEVEQALWDTALVTNSYSGEKLGINRLKDLFIIAIQGRRSASDPTSIHSTLGISPDKVDITTSPAHHPELLTIYHLERYNWEGRRELAFFTQQFYEAIALHGLNQVAFRQAIEFQPRIVPIPFEQAA
jgi:hypothetical protein